MERLPSIKWIVIKKSEFFKANKGERVEKTKTTLNGWNKRRWEELVIDLSDIEMIGSTWREARRLKRIDMTVAIIMKVWYSHRSMRTPFRKGMESTFDFEATRIPQHKKKEGLACRISRSKHMIEISTEVFVVGPTRARSYSTIMYKAVHMTYEASPSRHSQGLFKTQRDHCKTNRG